MNVPDIQLLYDYNYWANQLILTTAAHLTPEQLQQPTRFSWGSLHGTLVHILDSENMWRHLCRTSRIPTRLTEIRPFPTLDSVAAFWKTEETAMREYLAGLTDADLNGLVRYQADGSLRERVLWHCLVHVVNHGTQHRAECAVMLTDCGHSPGELDLTRFLNTRAPALSGA